MLILRLAVTAILLLSLAACLPLPRAFGVSIGMDRASARRALLNDARMHYRSTYACRIAGSHAHDPACGGAEMIDHYGLGGMMARGAVDIYILRGRVAKVEWWQIPFSAS